MTLAHEGRNRDERGRKRGSIRRRVQVVIVVEAREKIETSFIHSAICFNVVGHSGSQRLAEKPSIFS